MEVIQETPDTPMSVLELFSTSKDSIKLFGDNIIDQVKEGKVDPLRVAALTRTMDQISKYINDNIKENQRTEALKYGEKPFNAFGCEMHYTAVDTKYEYASCGDEVYDRLMQLKANLDQQIKNRQEWLKMMGKPEILVDEATGSQYTAYPPIKKTTMGLKVTIK